MAKEAVVPVTNTEVAVQKLDLGFNDLDLLSDLKKEGTIIGLDITPSDIKLPRFRLMQPTSMEVTQQKVQAGTFYNAATGEAVKELPCTLLIKSTSRVMWEKTFKRGDKPVCRSFDSVKSYDGKKECAKCPHQNWDTKSEDDSKPACNMSYGWLALSRLPESMNQPFRIIVPGKSVSHMKDFLTQLVAKGYPAFVYNVTLVPEFMSNEKGAFYVIKYRIDSNLAANVLNEMGLIKEALTYIKTDESGKKETLPTEMGLAYKQKLKDIYTQFEEMINMYKDLFKEVIEMDMDEPMSESVADKDTF
jgi:hypothetical protein